MDVDATGCDNECIDIGEFSITDFCRGATSRTAGHAATSVSLYYSVGLISHLLLLPQGPAEPAAG